MTVAPGGAGIHPAAPATHWRHCRVSAFCPQYFQIDGKHTIEVGGQNKTGKQLGKLEDSYLAADNLEYGNGQKIPLWLFGFLY